MKIFYSGSTGGFYFENIHENIPNDSIEITEQKRNELLDALNKGCIIFNDLTVSKPKPSFLHEWNGSEWVLNKELEVEFSIKQNQSTKEILLAEVNQQISMLQDAVDLDMAGDGDEDSLKAWKKYRVLLNRVDTGLTDIEWPEKP